MPFRVSHYAISCVNPSEISRRPIIAMSAYYEEDMDIRKTINGLH